jgi:hypothetical protein
MFPPGYNSKAATRRLAQLETGPNTSGKPLFTGSGEESEEQIEAVKRSIYAGYPQVLKDLQMIAGTPDNVIPKLCKILEVLRPGIFSFWLDGPVSAKERKRCLELLNRDVIPALREYGKNLGFDLPVRTGAGFATVGTRRGLCGGLQRGGVGGRVERAYMDGDDLHQLRAVSLHHS